MRLQMRRVILCRHIGWYFAMFSVDSRMGELDWRRMTVRYIGSKARLVDAIMDIIGEPTDGSSHFVDAFCGTGVVARTAALRGWSVSGNDTLLSATYLAEASLFSEDALDFSSIGSYRNAVDLLNEVPLFDGYFWRTYSPASLQFCEHERRYFSEDNARKIDGIRSKIADWNESGYIGYKEQVLLTADLIEAANDVANIAGTYGCFLKKWMPQAQGLLVLQPRTLFPNSIEHQMSVGDVFNIATDKRDTVYLDPPYTKRQYASYYHIPETIAYHDEPIVEGVAGLRPWRQIASPFCYKAKALEAVCECVDGLEAQRIFLSYSSQGHVALSELLEALPKLGKVVLHELGKIGRYRPNRIAAKGDSAVEEYLIEIDKSKKG